MTHANTCPNCSKPPKEAYAPFCSKRCQQVDLNRWFTGAYAAAAVDAEDWDGENTLSEDD